MQQRHHAFRLALCLIACLVAGLAWSQQAAPPDGAATTTPPPTATTPPPAAGAEAPALEPSILLKDAATLKVFGRDLFRTAAGTFEPNSDAPVPPDYVLGAGDTLAIICWSGSVEYERASVTISPTGDVYLKLLGAIPLAQKTLAQAQADLQKRYARYYTKFELKVDLVGQRSIAVFVMGEVVKPGKYMLSSLSTVFTALYASGGPTDVGSLRRIRLTRGAGVEGELDLYDYLLTGKIIDLPLKSGDTVFVPVAGNLVTVSGEVRRPAKYELRGTETLGEIIALAGGATAQSADRISLARVGPDRVRKVLDLRMPADAGHALLDGDEIAVQPVLKNVRNAVQLTGAVNRPGNYPVEEAATVWALLKLAEGVTADAYFEQAILSRQEEDSGDRVILPLNLRAILLRQEGADVRLRVGDIVRVFQRDELPELFDSVSVEGEITRPGRYPYQEQMRVADLVQLAFGLSSKAFFQRAYLYRYPFNSPPQMVAVNLAKALAGDAQENLPLQPRDRLVITSQFDVEDFVVRVEGEVAKPGNLTFFDGMKISDALFLTGGLKPNVALDRALLIRLNPKTYAEELVEVSLRSVLSRDPAGDLPLRDGDRLVVYPIEQMGDRQLVTVEGAVNSPGAYPYVGEMRLSHLIFLAKGLRTDAFTRRGDLYRTRADNSVEIIPIDLVAAASGVASERNPLLQPRDRLVVARREEKEDPLTVKIDGYVRQPGEYPLTAGMRLSDLLHLAGGLRADADPKVEVYRIDEGAASSTTYAVTVEEDGRHTLPTDPRLRPHDLVSVQGNANYVKMTETINIRGEVKHPGAYPAFQAGTRTPKTLYQVVAEAGDVLTGAYPAGIVLYRKEAAIHTDRQLQELAQSMRYLDTLAGIPAAPRSPATPAESKADTEVKPAPAPKADAEAEMTAPRPVIPESAMAAANADSLSRSLARVFTTDQGNTVVLVVPPRSMQEQSFSLSIPVNAETALQSKGRRGDVTLEPGDIIYVPKQPTTVTVLGGVTSNGSVIYREGQSLNYYLNAVGGIAPDGDKGRIVVMRMNGLILPAKQAKGIQPGDIIIVPTKHMLHVIHTKGPFERVLRSLSQLALTYLPFAN